MTDRILVAVDLEDTDLNDRLLSVTADFAKLKAAEVTLVYVGPELPAEVAVRMPDDYQTRTSAEISKQLDGLVDKLGLPAGTTKIAVRFGAIYREILAQAKADKSDLIIIGCHKPDLADFLLGPNAARVVRHASCSVFVVR